MDVKLYKKICDIFRSSAQASTSSVPELWTPHNPLLGHCAVASLVVQEVYGGKIRGGSILIHDTLQVPHYWNQLDGKDWDFTKEQLDILGAVLLWKDGNRRAFRGNGTLTRFYQTYQRYLAFRAKTIYALNNLILQ